MKTDGSIKNQQKKITRHFESGKIYFSRRAEQRFYFALTIIMLLAGILYKFGLLH